MTTTPCHGWKCEAEATESRDEHYFCADHAANYDYAMRREAEMARFSPELRAELEREARAENRAEARVS